MGYFSIHVPKHSMEIVNKSVQTLEFASKTSNMYVFSTGIGEHLVSSGDLDTPLNQHLCEML